MSTKTKPTQNKNSRIKGQPRAVPRPMNEAHRLAKKNNRLRRVQRELHVMSHCGVDSKVYEATKEWIKLTKRRDELLAELG